MSINIQVLSDLHLESPKAYDIFEISPAAPYLALLGDIGYTTHAELFDFLRVQLRRFEAVFFLLGNHEPYESSWAQAVHTLQEFEAKTSASEATSGKFIFLNQTRYDLNDKVTVLGCTLFSQVPKEQYDDVSFGLNDFYRIKEWTVDAHNACHQADLHWLNEQVSKLHRTDPDRQIVVLTHHSPTTDVRTINPRNVASKISGGFMTDLSGEACWLTGNVHTWVFGHSHYNCDLIDSKSGIRMVTNQRGYYFAQAADFAGLKVISI